jgi:phosphoribosylglycinamide formyltransferase-1
MAKLEHSPESKRRLARLVDVGRSFPEVEVRAVGLAQEHREFRVRKKVFAYYLFDHHSDGRVALTCKAPPGEQGRLVAEQPRRYFVPPYVGPKGWVGLRLDLPRLSWQEVRRLLLAGYFMTAPQTLRSRLASVEPRR